MAALPIKVITGSYFTFVLRMDGTDSAFGDDSCGQLGDGNSGTQSMLAVEYDINGVVTSSLTAEYEIWLAAGNSLTAEYLIWNIVTASLTAEYAIIAIVTKSLQVKYVLFSLTPFTCISLCYNVGAKNENAIVAIYNVTGKTASTLQACYEIAQPAMPGEPIGIFAGKDFSFVLMSNHILDTFGDNCFGQLGNGFETVTNTLTVDYTVEPSINSSYLTLNYGIQAIVVNSIVFPYRIGEPTSALALQYNVLPIVVTHTLALKYRLYGYVTHSLALSYSCYFEKVVSTGKALYNIEESSNYFGLEIAPWPIPGGNNEGTRQSRSVYTEFGDTVWMAPQNHESIVDYNGIIYTASGCTITARNPITGAAIWTLTISPHCCNDGGYGVYSAQWMAINKSGILFVMCWYNIWAINSLTGAVIWHRYHGDAKGNLLASPPLYLFGDRMLSTGGCMIPPPTYWAWLYSYHADSVWDLNGILKYNIQGYDPPYDLGISGSALWGTTFYEMAFSHYHSQHWTGLASCDIYIDPAMYPPPQPYPYNWESVLDWTYENWGNLMYAGPWLYSLARGPGCPSNNIFIYDAAGGALLSKLDLGLSNIRLMQVTPDYGLLIVADSTTYGINRLLKLSAGSLSVYWPADATGYTGGYLADANGDYLLGFGPVVRKYKAATGEIKVETNVAPAGHLGMAITCIIPGPFGWLYFHGSDRYGSFIWAVTGQTAFCKAHPVRAYKALPLVG